MNYDAKMNIKRALAAYLVTSMVVTQPGVVAAATVLTENKESDALVSTDVETTEVAELEVEADVEIEVEAEEETEVEVEAEEETEVEVEAEEETEVEAEAEEDTEVEAEEETEVEAEEETEAEAEVEVEEVDKTPLTPLTPAMPSASPSTQSNYEVNNRGEIVVDTADEAMAMMTFSNDILTMSDMADYIVAVTSDASSLTNATITITEYSNYNGDYSKDMILKPVVKMGTKTLVENTDYILIYPNDTVSLGQKDITIRGIADYSGETTATYYVSASLEKAVAAFNEEPNTAKNWYTYTGSVVVPTVDTMTVTGVDVKDCYDISHPSDAINVTTSTNHKLVLTGDGEKYNTWTSYTYVYGIQAANIADVTLKDPKSTDAADAKKLPDQAFTGTAQWPDYALEFNGIDLEYTKDYTQSWRNNTEIGTATLIVTGKGNFTGTLEITFDIVNGSSTVNLLEGAINPINEYKGTINYVGKACTFADVNIGVYNRKTATATLVTEGTHFDSYIVVPDDTTSTQDIIDALIADSSNVSAAVQERIDAGGYPGENVYIIIGKGNYEGCYDSQTFDITGWLGHTTVTAQYDARTDKTQGTEDWQPVTSYAWNGGLAVKPENVEVKFVADDLILDATTDYTVAYTGATDQTALGTVTMTVGGQADSDFKGSKTGTYSIVAADLSANNESLTIKEGKDISAAGDGSEISLTQLEDQIYTGSIMWPTFTLQYELSDGTLYDLVFNTDYTQKWTNNTEIGTATLTVTGKGNFSGVREITFDIVKDAGTNLLEGAINPINEYKGTINYVGKACTLADVNIGVYNRTTDKEVLVTEGTHFDSYIVVPDDTTTTQDIIDALIADSSNLSAAVQERIDAGGYPGENVYIIIGKGSYEGSYDSQTFDITGWLGYTTVTAQYDARTDKTQGTEDWQDVSSYVWDGGLAVKPEHVAVKYVADGLILDIATDYTVAYTGATDQTGLGTVTMTVGGQTDSDFQGAKTGTYSIVAADLSANNESVILKEGKDISAAGDGSELSLTQLEDQAYTGTAQWPTFTLQYELSDGTLYDLVFNTDYTQKWTNNIEVGTATLTVTGKGNFSGVREITFDIKAEGNQFTEATIETIAAQSYSGTKCNGVTPSVTDVSANKKLTEDTDYVAYLVNLTADETITTAIDTLVNELAAAYQAVTDSNALDLSNVADLTEAVAVGGLPGENYYIIIGLGDTYGESYVYKAFDVVADLSKADVEFWDTTDADETKHFEVDFYYCNGSDFVPSVVLTYDDGNYTLPSTYYSSTCTSTSTQCTATVTIVPAEDCTFASSTLKPTVEIKGYDLSADDTVISYDAIAALEFKSYSLTPIPSTVTFKNDDLDAAVAMTRNVDFTVAYKDNTNVAAATAENPPTIILTGIGNYTGTYEIPFEIALEAGVVLTVTDISEQTYISNFVTPEPTKVTAEIDGGRIMTLVKDVDYELSYANNLDVATADATAAPTVTITGIGNYAATTAVDKTFAIVGDFATDATVQLLGGTDGTTVLNNTDHTYTGADITPGVKVTIGGTALTATTDSAAGDYTVEYKDNKELGTATVTITPESTFPYTGSIEVTFEIVAVSISDGKVGELDPDDSSFSEGISDQTFTGNYITPEPAVQVTVGTTEVILEKDVDYTLSYRNNVNVADDVATVVVTGIGNYSGTLEETFNIAPDSSVNLFEDAVVSGISTQEFSGTAVEPKPTLVTIVNPITNGVTVLKYDTDYVYGIGTEGNEGYIAAYEDNVETGTGILNIVGKTGSNYEGSHLAYEFDIVADLSKAKIDFSTDAASNDIEYVWANGDVAPSIEVYFGAEYGGTADGDYDLTETDEYTYSYDTTSTDVGEKTVTISAVDGTSINSTTDKFEIIQLDMDDLTEDTDFTIEVGQMDYTGSAVKPSYDDITITIAVTDDSGLVEEYVLTEDDYTISFKDDVDDTNIGDGSDVLDAVVVISAKAGSNITFTTDIEHEFTITGASATLIENMVFLDIDDMDVETTAFTVTGGDSDSETHDLLKNGTLVIETELNDEKIDITEFFAFTTSDDLTTLGLKTITGTGITGTIYDGETITQTFNILADLDDCTFTTKIDANGALEFSGLTVNNKAILSTDFTVVSGIFVDGSLTFTLEPADEDGFFYGTTTVVLGTTTADGTPATAS